MSIKAILMVLSWSVTTQEKCKNRAVKPKLIICDEPISALDISVQAKILALLKQLQQQYQLGYLFITHNISVVESIAHYVAVMYQGRIIEQGGVEQVLKNPQHDYTKNLLAAVPRVEAGFHNN